jgi:hypothetical protein
MTDLLDALRAETPDAPPQTETLWPENPDTQGD